MSDDPNRPNSGRVVDFSVSMTPSSRMTVTPPAERATQPAERLSREDLHRGTKGGLVIMKILSMSDEEKRAHVVTQIGDPIFMWWSFLTLEERRQFLKAAETQLRETLMG